MKKVVSLIAFLFLLAGSLFSQEKLVSRGVMPVLAYAFIPMDQINPERFSELKEAGINLCIDNFPDVAAMKSGLDLAAKAGVKLLISCPELKSEPEKTAKLFMNHPAMGGYYIYDEPSMKLFPELCTWCKRIQTVDNKNLLYVNIWPNFASPLVLGAESYEVYVHEFLKQLPVQVVSFDYYPVMSNRLSKTWYENLELISTESRKKGLPFWAFALTSNYDEEHLNPQSLAALRVQMFSNLAYGAQGICYYEYWDRTPVTGTAQEDDRGGSINARGKRTVVFDRIKQMSAEIQALSPVFLGAKVISVRHTGLGKIPVGTIRLVNLPKAIHVLGTNGASALVSVLENGANSYVVIVNKDFLNSINLIVAGDETLQKVLKDGSIVPASAYESSLELDPGDVAIYMFPTEKK
ncbi:MAG: beta-galactosidase [Bacteroidota bacterium]|nr:beta-galactosidase [Bacteroidota bacterium]